MTAQKIFLVHLRRPRSVSQDPDERRDDPFYEFGSFGCTKCHSRNLFHPRHASDLEGARLGFVQGGPNGFRLVFLTPLITVKVWPSNCEARWRPVTKPFKYNTAPILVHNDGTSDFPLVNAFVRKAAGRTPEGSLSSRFRSRAKALNEAMASEVVEVFERLRSRAAASAFATTYDEALPWRPPIIDLSRESTYRNRLLLLAEEERESEENAVCVTASPVVQDRSKPGCRPSNAGKSTGATTNRRGVC